MNHFVTTRVAGALLAAALLPLAGCSAASGASSTAAATITVTATPTPTPTPTPTAAASPTTATAVARALEDAIPKVTEIVNITEDNDPNNLIGRSNGYTGAAVLYDARTHCSDGLGADCGASIEQWPTAKAAKVRGQYIQRLLTASPVLGSEYDHSRGVFLLRVAGDLKPSVAKKYLHAFHALF